MTTDTVTREEHNVRALVPGWLCTCGAYFETWDELEKEHPYDALEEEPPAELELVADRLREAVEGSFHLARDASGFPVVETADQAEWALRKLHRIARAENRVQELYDAERERLDTWRNSEMKKTERDREFFESLLKRYHASLIEKDPTAPSTIKLPHGQLKARQQQPEWIYDDPEDVVHWALSVDPRLVRVKHEPDKEAIKNYLAIDAPRIELPAGHEFNPVDPKTGEEIESIRIVARPRKFSVILSEEA